VFTFRQLFSDIGEVYALAHTAKLLNETTNYKYLKTQMKNKVSSIITYLIPTKTVKKFSPI